MWIRTQSGNLVNLSNCTAVQKVGPTVPTNDQAGYAVIALDASAGSTYVLASKLNEENADKMMEDLWRVIPEDQSVWVAMPGPLR